MDSIGVDYAVIDGAIFVRHVFSGGPAAKAGLVRGDRIVSADGRRFDPVRSLAGRRGRTVALAVERRKGAHLTVKVVPRETRPVDEWLEAQDKGSAVVVRAGRRIAYTYLYSCAGAKPLELLGQTMQERFAGAEAQQIIRRDADGSLIAGSDPRADGRAAGA